MFTPRIVLNGKRQKRRYLVELVATCGDSTKTYEVWLTPVLYVGFIGLVAGAIRDDPEPSTLTPLEAHRLRRELRDACSAIDVDLVVNCGSNSYELQLPRTHIVLTDRFLKRQEAGLIPQYVWETFTSLRQN